MQYKNYFNCLHHRTAHFHCTVESIEREGIAHMIFKSSSLGTTIRKVKEGGGVNFCKSFSDCQLCMEFFMDMFLHAYFFSRNTYNKLFFLRIFFLHTARRSSNNCYKTNKMHDSHKKYEHQGIPNLQSGL